MFCNKKVNLFGKVNIELIHKPSGLTIEGVFYDLSFLSCKAAQGRTGSVIYYKSINRPLPTTLFLWGFLVGGDNITCWARRFLLGGATLSTVRMVYLDHSNWRELG